MSSKLNLILTLIATGAFAFFINSLGHYIPDRWRDSIVIFTLALGAVAGLWTIYETLGWNTMTTLYVAISISFLAGASIFGVLAYKSHLAVSHAANTSLPSAVSPKATGTAELPSSSTSSTQSKYPGRQQKEEALRHSNGTLVTHQFSGNPDNELMLVHRGTRYSIPISMSDAEGVWIYSKSESVLLYEKVRLATTGQIIDLTKLRSVQWHQSKRTEHVAIGEHIFFRMEDGTVIQMLLVMVRYFRGGDDSDEARFRYEIHERGAHLIPALGPPAVTP